MASPVDSARQGTNITTAATSHAINVGSPVAGTLLIVLVRFAAAPGTVTFTGYTQFATDTSDASDDQTELYYRQADGAEGATDTLSTTNSVKLAAICWEITGAENPATEVPIASTVAIGTAANINPGAGSLSQQTILSSAGSSDGSIQGGTGTSEQQGNQFTALRAELTSVRARIAKVGAPTDDLVVEVQTDSGDTPSGTVVGTVATVAGASLTTTPTDTTWSGLSIALTAGQKYWIVMSRSGSRDTSNYFIWRLGSFGLTNFLSKPRDSGAWGSAHSTDFVTTVTFGGAVDALFLTVIGLDSETATATQPAGYSNLASANSGTGGAVATNCMIWGASKQATAVSDDPAAWTSTAPATGVTAWTIAIPPPAAAAAPGPASSRRRRQASRYLTFR